MATEISDDRRKALEARLAAFEKNADELWRMLHDPHLLSRHLAELLSAPSDLLTDASASDS